ncbi:hypothetical protein HYW41_05195 [Candidatus Daviesbacteria bacterium]|nr:hypothetical protein [Candidatus Daviesbacteria bacterium]
MEPNNNLKQKGYFLPIIGVIILILVVGTGAYFYGKGGFYLNKASPSASSGVQVPNTTSMPQSTSTVPSSRWIETDVAVSGLEFKYPQGWHVVDTGLESNEILMGSKPFVISTGEGSTADIKITVKNGLPNPEEQFNKRLSEEKSSLINTKEEILTNKYFDKIYHLQGKLAGDGMYSGRKIDWYIFMLTNPKYIPSDKLNISVIEAEPVYGSGVQNISEILKEVVLSVKECHYTWCEND